MSPTASVSAANNALKSEIATQGPALPTNGKSKTSGKPQPHLSSTDIIGLEHKHGAHNGNEKAKMTTPPSVQLELLPSPSIRLFADIGPASNGPSGLSPGPRHEPEDKLKTGTRPTLWGERVLACLFGLPVPRLIFQGIDADVCAFSATSYHPLPVVFESAKGARVWDPEGNMYIDMLSAYSAVNQGHCHPRIINTLVEQSQRLTLSSRAFYNSVFGRFAQHVTSLFGYDMVLPMNTGAEAVETAIKLSRKWAYEKKGVKAGKAVVLSVEGNFHGRTLGIISMSTDPESRTGFGPYLEGVGPTYIDQNGTQQIIRYGVLDDLEKAFALYSDVLAAFLVEPIQGEAGIVVPPEGYLKGVAALCKKHNVLFICDEIQTGLCRTGKMLACEWEDVRPDIILLGKALSGGVYPVSAVLADKEVMLCIRPGEHGSTYGGNPLGAAVAITALNVLVDEKLADRALRLGEYFRSTIKASKSPLIKEVRGRGLLNAVVVDESKSKKGRTAWQFCLLLKSRGVLAKPTHVNIIRFAPPLVISEEDLKKAVQIILECFDLIDQLDEIPGEDEEEKGHVDTLDD